MQDKIAILGAHGTLGREILKTLADKKFPLQNIVALSDTNVGTSVSYGTQTLTVEKMNDYDYSGTKIAISTLGELAIAQKVDNILSKKAALIDCSGLFSADNVNLIVHTINSDNLNNTKKRNIVVNPLSETIHLVKALSQLHQNYDISNIVVSTYQSVSDGGKEAMDELYNQTKKMFEASTQPSAIFTKRIAFNCIPHIGDFLDSGETYTEHRIAIETQKILDITNVTITCVRVPVFNSNAMSVHVTFNKDYKFEEVQEIFYESKNNLLLIDRHEDGGYMTPVDTNTDDNIYVSRLRQDPFVKNGLNMWIVGDNIHTEALNAVNIAQKLLS